MRVCRVLDIRGVSMIELMIATLIFSVVVTFALRFLVLQNKWALLQEDIAEAQQQGRISLDFMGRDLALLGFGVPEGEARILNASREGIEFLANLRFEITHLIEAAAAGQTVLLIDGGEFVQGKAFRVGKTVSICDGNRCEWHSLARDGGASALELNEGLVRSFSDGSVIQVINRVRYALRSGKGSGFKLIRTVDGGGNPVAEDLASLQMEYLDREGIPVTLSDGVDRIRIRIESWVAERPPKLRSLTGEVFLRNR